MRVIRHQIAITDYQVLVVPEPNELLSVAVSRTIPNHGIDLWSLDLEKGDRPRQVGIYVIGTGNPMPDILQTKEEAGTGVELFGMTQWRKFIGTVVTPSGMVWHVFQGPVLK